MTKTNRLWGMRVYEAGPIDRSPNYEQWRNEITPRLNDLGIIVLNPCDKPTQLGCEIGNEQQVLKDLTQKKDYDGLAKKVREIRSIDLRLIDLSDFIIALVDMDIVMIGTIEEIVLANKQKKPVLVCCPQAKQQVGKWLFGMIPHCNIFDDLDCLFDYLNYINSAEEIDDLGRWRFFDYRKLYSQIGLLLPNGI